jgi:hypothetical protein
MLLANMSRQIFAVSEHFVAVLVRADKRGEVLFDVCAEVNTVSLV